MSTPSPVRQPTIELVPLSMSNCLDLGVRFYGKHLRQILTLWLLLAVPFCTWVFFRNYHRVDTFPPYGFWAHVWQSEFVIVSICLFFLTMIMGVMLTSMAAPAVMGEPFTLRSVWQQLPVVVKLSLLGCWYQCVVAGLLMLLVIPGIWAATRLGYFAENRFFAEADPNSTAERRKQVISRDFDTLMGSLWWSFVFFEVLVFITFTAIDSLSNWLFRMPILFRRAIKPESALSSDAQNALLLEYLNEDPIVLATYAAVVLLVYPIVRLAWFFRYVDLQVRRDCWDLQIQFADEVDTLREERTV